MSIKLRSKKTKDGAQSLYLDIYHNRNRSYEFLGIKIEKNDPLRKQKKETAEKIRSQKELELTTSFYNLPSPFTGDRDFIEYFESKYKDYSSRAAKNKLVEFAGGKVVNGKLSFNLVDEKFLNDFKEWLLKRISNNTTWVYIYKLKAILNKAVKEKIIPYNPAKYVSIKNEETEKIHLTLDELQKLYKTECEDEEIKKAFLFSCYTGLRLSDVRQLTWQQIREGKLFFRQKKTRGLEYLPLNKFALSLLASSNPKVIPLPEMLVFKLNKNKIWCLGKTLRDWAKEAGINKYITFHTARHTFATLALSKGVDLYTVSKMLGHKNINTTQIYAKIIDKTVEKAVQKLPSLTAK